MEFKRSVRYARLVVSEHWMVAPAPTPGALPVDTALLIAFDVPAAVGENVPDQSLHAQLIALLKRLEPKNNAQAAMIARQAGQEAVTETQTSLFGDEQVAESLDLERAKVLDQALKRLKQDRANFKVLSDRTNTIVETGNVLNTEADAQHVGEDSKASAYLSAEANRKGAISDAFAAAARDLKANSRQGARIVSNFIAAVRAPQGAEP